jgi:hypothetical protein
LELDWVGKRKRMRIGEAWTCQEKVVVDLELDWVGKRKRMTEARPGRSAQEETEVNFGSANFNSSDCMPR